MSGNKLIIDQLLERIKDKGIFSEYLPKNFNLESSEFNIYGAGASHKDKIEPYSYYMSRFGEKGDRRLISIPEISGYVALVNYLRDNKEIITDIVNLSIADKNSFSRLVNDDEEISDADTYGKAIYSIELAIDDETNEALPKKHSNFIDSMFHKIKIMKGACGILHVDIAEFYRSIYTHSLCAIGMGIDESRRAFLENSNESKYIMYCRFDDRVRRLNGARTNGILTGPYISRVISEAILAKVDEELTKAGLVFVRYADDYEVAIYNEDDINDTKSKLIAIFDRYFFRINNEKTVYEKYPFYRFKNYERILKSILPENISISAEVTEELFTEFQQIELDGNKGAIRYLLQEYRGKLDFEDKELYTSYLLNLLCNDEKALGIVCDIISDDYKKKRINIDNTFYDVILRKLKSEMKDSHDLETIWLVYLLRQTEYKMTYSVLKEILNSNNELAIIVAIEEWKELISKEDFEKCWEKAKSWILLYQIALNDEDKRDLFIEKLGISHNRDFYQKLFQNGFSFYKRCDGF